MVIRALPALLVNQIAAGEVIERPASVVKELVENSIDAGANRIDVAVEQGGRELVQVRDDGWGIEPEQLPLALMPHATSKLERSEDLDAIATLGFRGEALASIASVSRLMIRSRTRASEAAFEIRGEGADVTDPRPASGPIGTTVAVRNLFFNTPARRKFLRTEATELRRMMDAVHALALAHPAIGFSFTSDGQQKFDLPPEQTERDRVLDVLGRELETELLELGGDDRGVRLWGMVGRPSIARGTGRHLQVFVNGRPISDRSAMHAIREAYRGLIEPGRYPTAVLFLQVDPNSVDVNVHPTKAEVRFRQPGVMHGVIHSAVRRALREADLMPEVEFRGGSGGGQGGGQARQEIEPRLRPIDWGSGRTGGPTGGQPGGREGSEAGGGGGGSDSPAPSSGTYGRADRDAFGPGGSGYRPGSGADAARNTWNGDVAAMREALGRVIEGHGDEQPGAMGEALPTVRAHEKILQVHSSYIVTEDEQGMVIIDQHALHERVMFEKLRSRMADGNLESQRLLMPAVVEADSAQREALDELQPLLERLGIEASAMGPRRIGVHAFTSLLFERKVDPVTFMQDLLTRAAEEPFPTEDEAALHEVLDMMACKAAVKAGDRLEGRELEELLAYRETIERSSNCPHGRPTSLRLSLQELERQFGRR